MAGPPLQQRLLLAFCLLLVQRLAKAHSGSAQPPANFTGEKVRSQRREYYGRELAPEAYKGAPKALLGVFSSARSAQSAWRRELARSTWGKFVGKNNRISMLFVMSAHALSEEQHSAALTEAGITRDMLLLQPKYFQGRAHSKVFEFLFWVSNNAPGYDFVVKVDEDVWLNPFHLQRLLISLPRRYTYWGLLRRGTDGDKTRYMDGWMVVLSHDMLTDCLLSHCSGSINNTLDAWSSSATGPPNGVVLGEVLHNSALTITQLETYPADNFELYDWGPDKEGSLANDEADDGQPPFETIAVHALRRAADYILIHEYFAGCLLRWNACVAKDFDDPARCRLALDWQLNMG